METEKVSTNIQTSGMLTIVKTAIGLGVGYIAVRLLGIGGTLALLPSSIIGYLFAHYYVIEKNRENESWVKFIHWTNVVTWLLPIIGIATSVFSLTVAEGISQNKTKLFVLGYVGLTLTILNAIAGVLLFSSL